MTKKTIWVIDDDPIYQIIINKLIKKSDFFSTANSFKNGKEAIDLLQNTIKKDNLSSPDIILLDINMPIMDGWEFLEALEILKPGIEKKIIIYIVSSSIALEDKNKSKKYLDVLGYISKPISIDDLIHLLPKD
jgi:CheY-like chemotaxis protein